MTGRLIRAFALTLIASLCIPLLHSSASAHTLRNFRKERRHVEKRARSQTGARYTYGGESPRRGFDCSGFTSWVFEDHGSNLPRVSRDQFHLAKKRGHIRVWKRKRLRAGDLVFFSTGGRRIGHAGIYVGKGKFISSTSSSGIRVDSVYDRYYWGKRWVGATRLRVTRR